MSEKIKTIPIEDYRKNFSVKYGDGKRSILEFAIAERKYQKVCAIIKSNELDLNTLCPQSDPLLFQIIDSTFYLSQKQNLIRLMVEHGADIHICHEWRGNILSSCMTGLESCSRSTSILEFLLTEFKFNNEEMLQAVESVTSLKELRIFLAHGLKLSPKAVEQLLFNAVQHCETRLTEVLLKEYDASVDCVNEAGRMPLHYANDWHDEIWPFAIPFSRYRRIVKLLLKYGADVNAKEKDSHITPLMRASNLDVFNFLLRHGADIHAKTRTLHKNVLMKQAENYRALPIIRSLVEDHVFDLNQKDKNGATVLFRAVEAGNPEVVKYLLLKGADIKVSDKNGCNILFVLRSGHSFQLVKYLIRQDINLNHLDNNGRSALFQISDIKHLRILLKAGADATVVANDGSIVLMNPDLELPSFILLIKSGADPSKAPGGVQGLLIWWLEHGNRWTSESILLYLIKTYSLNPNIRDQHGRSAIFYSYKDHTRNALVKHGAMLAINDNQGNTPLLTWYQTSEPVSKCFLKNLNHQNNEGKTVLHYAVENSDKSTLKDLLDHGADWHIKDNTGHTALDYARELKRLDICELFENYKH